MFNECCFRCAWVDRKFCGSVHCTLAYTWEGSTLIQVLPVPNAYTKSYWIWYTHIGLEVPEWVYALFWCKPVSSVANQRVQRPRGFHAGTPSFRKIELGTQNNMCVSSPFFFEMVRASANKTHIKVALYSIFCANRKIKVRSPFFVFVFTSRPTEKIGLRKIRHPGNQLTMALWSACPRM